MIIRLLLLFFFFFIFILSSRLPACQMLNKTGGNLQQHVTLSRCTSHERTTKKNKNTFTHAIFLISTTSAEIHLRTNWSKEQHINRKHRTNQWPLGDATCEKEAGKCLNHSIGLMWNKSLLHAVKNMVILLRNITVIITAVSVVHHYWCRPCCFVWLHWFGLSQH